MLITVNSIIRFLGSEKWSTIPPLNKIKQLNSNLHHLKDIEKILHFCTTILEYVIEIDTKITRMESKNDTSRWSIFKKTLPCKTLDQIVALNNSLENQKNETDFVSISSFFYFSYNILFIFVIIFHT